VIDADARCRLSLSGFRVVYHRVVESFPGGEEKRVLRFCGDRVEAQDVAVERRVGAVVVSASLAIDTQLRPDHPADEGGGASLAAAPSETAGVEVRPGRWAARPLRPAGERVLAGIEVRHEIVSRTESGAGAARAGLAVGSVSALGLTAAPGAPERADARRFDLTAALNEYLASHPAGASDVSTPLTFQAMVAGRVTVYPPAVAYDVAP
jgi:hypothetical protein